MTKPRIIILLVVYLIGISACSLRNRETDNQYCYDVESIKKEFASMDKHNYYYIISLTKDLEHNTKNLSQIKEELGIPIEEYMDTFKFGRRIGSSGGYYDHYYSDFPDTLWTMRALAIHKCVWVRGYKKITLYFLNDCNYGELPVWGHIFEYRPDGLVLPLRYLLAQNLTIKDAIRKMGRPNKEWTEEVSYGTRSENNTFIYKLKDVPLARIHMYQWDIGGSRCLLLGYLESEDKRTAKPIWGVNCLNWWLYVE